MKKIIILFLLGLSLCGCKNEYYCENGDILRGNICIIQRTTPAQVVYSCENKDGYILKNDKCCNASPLHSSYCIEADKSYLCSSGYLSGSNCIIETTYDALKK